MGERFPIDRLWTWDSGWSLPGFVPPRHVLVVDDEPFVRAGIVAVMQQLSPGLRVSEACDLGESLRQVWLAAKAADAVDLVLLDLNLPDGQGLATLAAFRRHCPLLPVVVVSAQQDAQTVLRAQEMGALCFIPKSCHAGQARQALGRLLTLSAQSCGGPPQGALPWLSPATASAGPIGLTDRQAEVLGQLRLGLTNKQIARLLNITESTVKIHVSAILRELGASNRTQALIKAALLGTGGDPARAAPSGPGHDV